MNNAGDADTLAVVSGVAMGCAGCAIPKGPGPIKCSMALLIPRCHKRKTK